MKILSLVHYFDRSAETTADYSDFHGEMQATDASGLPASMIVPDAPQGPQAPVDPQVASASQAAQDPKDLDVLIDEQSRSISSAHKALHTPLAA